ncbi:24735_t:CDS:2, partial [Racocetra persica]
MQKQELEGKNKQVYEFSINMIDLFGSEEVYNKEYEVEDCHINRNSSMCTPCKKC